MSRPRRTGVPEIDELMRKAKKRGARIEKGKRHWQVFGPNGEGPVVVASSRCSSGVIRATRGQLQKIGLRV